MTSHADLKIQTKLYYYAANVTAVYDGDTITVDLDLGLGVWRHGQAIRLWKVNTPELKGADRERGLAVRDLVRQLVLNKSVLVRTILDKWGEDRNEKFGRLLGEVLVPSEDDTAAPTNLNELLLAQGLAVPMGEDGSQSRSVARGGTPSRTIKCPFCGQTRQVDPTTAEVEQCPNCLDPAHPFAALNG